MHNSSSKGKEFADRCPVFRFRCATMQDSCAPHRNTQLFVDLSQIVPTQCILQRQQCDQKHNSRRLHLRIVVSPDRGLASPSTLRSCASLRHSVDDSPMKKHVRFSEKNRKAESSNIVYGRSLRRRVLLGTHAWHIQRTAFEEHHRSENNYCDICRHLDYVPSVGRPYARIKKRLRLNGPARLMF